MTDKQMRIIADAWQSYDCTMNDPWRNDFEEDGQAADEWRWGNMVNDIREQCPELSEDEVEAELDRYR